MCIHVVKGAKLGQTGLQTGSSHVFVHPQWCRITFPKKKTTCFHRILTHLWSHNGPLSRHFGLSVEENA